MLIAFNVKNFRSFKDEVSFSMVAANLKSKNKRIDEDNLFAVDESHSLLKSAVIYGANASGKSNLIKALSFMRFFVLKSASESQASEPIRVESFRLSTETEALPSEFEIIFWCDKKRFRYGFVVEPQKVQKEWLYHVPNQREAQLFNRTNDDFQISKIFREGKGLENKTRENALFLSVVAQFNGPISRSVIQWFNRLRTISGLDDWSSRHFSMQQLENVQARKGIVEFIKSIDLGISDMRVRKDKISETRIPEDMPEAFKTMLAEAIEISVETIHKKYDSSDKKISNVYFDLLKHESEGTKKALFLAGPLLNALEFAETLVVDELDSRLHPLITEAIIGMFNSEIHNPRNAQLIFASHDINLLKTDKYFRRDQIWFTEKDMYGATDLYSLAEIKVRNDARFQTDYMRGKYGAIPCVEIPDPLVGAQSIKAS